MVKSRYKEIVKVKKQKLSEIENQLLDVRNRKASLEKKISLLDEEIKSFDYPVNGDFAKMQLSKYSLSLLLLKKDEFKNKLVLRIKQIEGLELIYKEANIEYEKIMYLHNNELKKAREQANKMQSKEMDEIANILFENKRKKENI